MIFKTGEIVWVDLGHSFGRWPAIFQVPEELKKNRKTFTVHLNCSDTCPGFTCTNQPRSEPITIEKKHKAVRFFDDESLGKPLKIVFARNSKKHRERKGRTSVDGTTLKLAQFCTDVEMAEVVSGGFDLKVANLLSSVVQELEEAAYANPEEEVEEATNANPEEEVEEATNANPKEEVKEAANADPKEEDHQDQVITSEILKTGFTKETKQNTSKKAGKGKRERRTDVKARKENNVETSLHKVQSGRVKKERPKRESLKPKN